MSSLRILIGRVIICCWGSLLLHHALAVIQSASGSTATPTLLPRWRLEMRADAYPAPGPSDPDMFARRVMDWHVMYCGKNRVCRDYVSSSCYRCAPCQCDLNCTTFGDCCPDLAMETGRGGFQRPFTGSDTNVMSCESTDMQNPTLEDSSKYTNSQTRSRIKKNVKIPKSESRRQRQVNVKIPKSDSRWKRLVDVKISKSESRWKRQVSVKIPKSESRLKRQVNLKESGLEMKTQNYLMISSCPHSFSADSSHCESSSLVAPVSAADGSSLVFKNIYCARCHTVQEVTSWDIRIRCENSKNITNLSTPRDVLAMLLAQPDCTVAYYPPSSGAARKCYGRTDMIARCNVTGLWTKRDSFLERACHSYLTPKQVGEQLYRNVYCFMCNHGDEPETHMSLTSCQEKPMSWNPNLELTIRHFDLSKLEKDVRPFGEIPYTLCKKRGIYDYMEDACREVTCEDGQQLMDGTCRPMFGTVRGLGYELYLGLRPTEDINVSGDHNMLHQLPAEVEIYLDQTLLKGKAKLLDFAMSFNTTDQDGRCSQTSRDLGVYTRLVSVTSVDQRQLQTDLLNVRHSTFHIHVGSWNMTFQAYPSETVWLTMQPSRRHAPLALSACVIIVSNTRLEHRREGTMRVGTTTPDPVTKHENQDPSYIRLSSLLTCPHVKLRSDEYSVTSPDGVLALKWGVKLPNSRHTMDLEGNFTICLSDFVQKLDKNKTKRSSEEEILAVVLLTLSILCLLASFLVFLLFTVLRSLPGKNNMVLVVCLCFSQISILIGYLVDEASRTCAVLGATVHYFTLCVFCSLIISSYHVYTIFTTMHLSRDVTKDRKSIVSYCCFIFLVPLAVVGGVIAMHASHRINWRSFGYGGGSFCLLSSTLSLWVALFLPVLASMVVVCVLFCMTLSSLHHNKDLETSGTDERHVNFYFRASLLACLTWMIGVPGLVTSILALRIAFIVFQCLLGLYVFVCLVLTPRVTRLLSGSCCQSRQPPRGRTSLNMKMASSDDCPVRPPCIVGTGYRKRDPNVGGSDVKRHPVERYVRRIEFAESVT